MLRGFGKLLDFVYLTMLRRFLFFLILATAILALPADSFAAARPNIILITLDSIRADRVGFLDAKHPAANLDALAKQSIIFERAYAQAPLTVVSHATILTGTYPQTHHASELALRWVRNSLIFRTCCTAAAIALRRLREPSCWIRETALHLDLIVDSISTNPLDKMSQSPAQQNGWAEINGPFPVGKYSIAACVL